MARKRSMFDIDFNPEPEAEAAPATPAPKPEPEPEAKPEPKAEARPEPAPAPAPAPAAGRRGPMASAITETADAARGRAEAEARIRAENDQLAHEHVRLKRLGLITDLIAVDAVKTDKLTRDRAKTRDPELEELKQSILDVGLSNPIRVEQDGAGGYELIQGFRRLTAFRELLEQTGDQRYARIPAAMVPRGEPVRDLYRKMVDENLVRKDISFGEMAQLALNYARETGIKPHDAVGELYASALKQKRSYIRSFTRVLERAHGTIRHPEAMPRALGLELFKIIDADPILGDEMIGMLKRVPDRDAEAETAILKDFVQRAPKIVKPRPKSVSKTMLRLPRPEGEAKIAASDGRVELRLARDFSALDRARLQRAFEAFFDALDG
ncbi:ParB/RepB/Spo0J family partition protein [Limimaricola pyoseonensis]|uniref:Chromosome partitioning protein, ParB family n=1 Tax=Limimaricola pyoseonensis TaxID=521013 RepID=A0A1G7ITM7_9RHOB|nr:ParB N-terminal domain-containing protein [Limimaricola pyoseonensis]SDF16027.1 chromosome partitioning protein, ParB family [Limimaricola pyoseonensis]